MDDNIGFPKEVALNEALILQSFVYEENFERRPLLFDASSGR